MATPISHLTKIRQWSGQILEVTIFFKKHALFPVLLPGSKKSFVFAFMLGYIGMPDMPFKNVISSILDFLPVAKPKIRTVL